VSVSARGLQGPDYWGSIFWDCDIYGMRSEGWKRTILMV
jgi:hypothetical protein